MKKRLALIGLIAALLLTAAGCGGAASSSPGEGVTMDSTAMDDGWSEQSPEAGAQTDSNSAGSFAARRENAKLILRAELSLETEDFSASAAAIDKLTNEAGGYYESSGTGGETGSRYADYVVRVPQEKFESFLASVGEQCHVVDSQQYADDIAEQYADLETRLATQNTKHERLLALLDQAGKMEDIIALENALAETEYEIDSLTGQKRAYDSLVDYSTITLRLREVQSLTAVSEGAGFGAQLKRAAASGLGGFGSFLRGTVLFAVTIWPLLLIAAIALAVTVHLRRRKKSKNDGSDENDRPAS